MAAVATPGEIMRTRQLLLALAAASFCMVAPCSAEETVEIQPSFNAELARATGADDYGMRRYVFVLLRSGPKPMAAGPERDEVFRGHFANMKRLVDDGKLVLAGPFDGVEGWRGLFVFAVADIEEARRLTATDPAIASGELVAEYHRYYGSAALMQVNALHGRLARKGF